MFGSKREVEYLRAMVGELTIKVSALEAMVSLLLAARMSGDELSPASAILTEPDAVADLASKLSIAGAPVAAPRGVDAALLLYCHEMARQAVNLSSVGLIPPRMPRRD